jgi:hypothetical protein
MITASRLQRLGVVLLKIVTNDLDLLIDFWSF